MKAKTVLSIVLLAVVLCLGLCLVACNSPSIAVKESGDMSGIGGANGNYYYDSISYAQSGKALDRDGGDEYTEISEQGFVETATEASSYFSIDANTSSYPNLRRYIRNNYTVQPNMVRIEEMLNYFAYDYSRPTEDIVALTASMFDSPYNSKAKLLTIGLATKEIDFAQQNNNLVFLIDTSGSMYGSDRLGLVQSAFKLLSENLNDSDVVSIVTYAGSDRIALEGALGADRNRITAVIEDLEASGSTNGGQGILSAYRLAEKYFIQGGNNRIVWMTDGDLNVGTTNTQELRNMVASKRESGVYLSIFGVGMGNYKEEKMEALALAGNGTCSYLDDLNEARRALVDQIGGTMVTVAKDVKAGITFDARYVQSYRLVGYENKRLSQEEFDDQETDAGELGSGHTVTVVYELVLTDNAMDEDAVPANVVVRCKTPDGAQNLEYTLPVNANDYHAEMTENDAFVASVVEFGLLLRNSQYKEDASLPAVQSRLHALQLTDNYKLEFVELVDAYVGNNLD